MTCLPASSSVASAAQFFSSRSCYNAFSNLQLQSRLPGASQHHYFPARSRAKAFCQSRVQTCIRQIDQRSLSADTGISASQIRCCSDPGFGDFYVKSTSLYGLVHILPTSFSKALRTPHFLRFFLVKSNCRQSFALFFDNFPRSRPATPETATLLRRPEKPGVSRPRVFSPVNAQTSELSLFPVTS